MYCQRILWRTDWLRNLDPKRFPAGSEDRVIILLRSIFETANGADALTLPILKAVSGCMYDGWTDRGLAWLEAMDRVPLLEIQITLHRLGLDETLDKAITFRLTQILGSPFTPSAKPEGARPQDGKTPEGFTSHLGRHVATPQSRPAPQRAEAKSGEDRGLSGETLAVAPII